MSKLSDMLQISDRHVELVIVMHMAYEAKHFDLPEDGFYSADTRSAYREMNDMYNRIGEIELNALSEASRALILECDGSYPKSMIPVLKRFMDVYTMRRLATLTATHFSDISVGNVMEKIPSYTSELSKIITMEGVEYEHGRSVADYLEHLCELKKTGQPMIGISTGIPKLDVLTGGFQKGKFYIVGGLEKLGKSRFCVYLTSLWLKKHAGIWFSLEMRAEDIHECVLSHRSMINSAMIGSPAISDDDLRKVITSAQEYLNEPLIIDTRSGVTPEYIREVIKSQKIKWQGKHTVDFVIVDYIQRMVYGNNRVGEMEDTAKKLADIARDENVIVIAVSQLSQEAERDQSAMSNPYRFIKGSKGIREAADCTIVLFRPNDAYESDAAKEIHAYVVQRKGVSNVAVNMLAQLQYTSFKENL